MIKAEGITLEFTEGALEEIANIAYDINMSTEDTGARRLVSVLNKITEDLSFNAPEIYEGLRKDNEDIHFTIDLEYVKSKSEELLKDKKDHNKKDDD